MRVVLGLLLGAASLVIIAAGGFWLWQQHEVRTAEAAAQQARAAALVQAQNERQKCEDSAGLLESAASDPPDTYTDEQIKSAWDVVLDCEARGISK